MNSIQKMNEAASSAPKARGDVAGNDESRSLIVVQCLIDFELEVAVVVLTDAEGKDLIDDRHHVVKRAHRLEYGRIGRTDDAPRSGQNERIFDGRQRDATIIESCGQETIVAADKACRSRHAAVGIQNLADVIVFREGLLHDRFLPEFQP